jgi:hypothetical protein
MFTGIANSIGKPLFVGEIGLHRDIPGSDYRTDEALALLDSTLTVIVELRIPWTFYWTFNDDRTWNKTSTAYQLRYGTTDAALGKIERANRELAAQE